MDNTQQPADLLAGILKEARASAARSGTVRALSEVLGAPLAEHCKVVSERRGRLLIDVDSAPLFAELRGFRTEEIRQGINARLPDRKFADVRFRLHQA